ncbi:MAG: DinB family protein [Chthonomonas sp.]|nr:DinB family protein [Chthonomonas sp.]
MHPYVLVAPSLTAGTLERLLHTIPEARFHERPDPNRFTIIEEIAHLADWEPIFLERIKGAAEQDGYVVTPYDESERAVTQRYADQPIWQSLEKFRVQREANLAYCRSLTETQLQREVPHPNFGPMRTIDLIGFMGLHDAYHIEHLTHFMGEKLAGTW